MMKNKTFHTYLSWLFAGLIWLISIVPFLYISQYAQPQFDDFEIWYVLNQMSYIEVQIDWYLSWTGRYTAFAFISALHPIIYRRPDLVSVFAIIYQIFFLFGLLWCFLRILPKSIRFREKLILSGLVWICYLWQLPSPSEAFYWIPATCSYQLGLLFCVITATLLWTNKSLIINSKVYYFLIALAILTPGTSEVNLLLFNGILFFTACFGFLIDRKFHKDVLIILIVSVIFSSFSLLSPGNNTRGKVLLALADKTAKPLDILFSLKASLVLIKNQIFGLWFRSPLLGLSLIYVLILRRNVDLNKYGRINKSLFFLYAIAWAGTLVILAVPFIYKAGIEYLPGRVLNIIQFVLVAGWFGFLSIMVLYNSFEVNYSFSFQALIYILGISLIIGSLIMPNKIMASITDIKSGNAKNYSVESENRYRLFENNRSKNIRVAPLSKTPYTIFICDILPDSSQDCNLAVSNYFGLKSVRVDSSLHGEEYLIY
jgi:hypothetical protein